MSRDDATNLQYAALPYRRAAGRIEVMLITSRETARWVIPKGWPAPALDPGSSAAQEALEESGLVGEVSAQPIGSYGYNKRLADGSAVDCTVEVFALAVEQQLPTWPEQAERRTRWFALEEAAVAVQEPELAAIIRNLAKLVD
jgi:predicted NUDIX family NTP pyrophosphohydrolase